jgi:putative transposase
MSAVRSVAPEVGVLEACEALGVPRASFYRHREPAETPRPAKPRRPSSHRALRDDEREEVLAVLNSPEFLDKAPAAVQAELLDRGAYLCSARTMYRILSAAGEVRERRDQLRHPTYVKPELVATGPNQVWSWDITKLLGPVKWTYYYLYVILDIFSRYIVGWMLAQRESAALAKRLIQETCLKEGVEAGELTMHADRGSAMISKTLALLLADLGVTKSHSRPHVSNDNPFSEAQFKTLKYRPEFPDRFGSAEHGLQVCRDLVHWYNHEHYHSALGYLTPAMVHRGRADEVLGARAVVLCQAYAAHPERFVRGMPVLRRPPGEVWINRPERSLEVDGRVGPGSAGPEEVRSTPASAPTHGPRRVEIVALGASGEAPFGRSAVSVVPSGDRRSQTLPPEGVIR